jgi:hypothetical protein
MYTSASQIAARGPKMARGTLKMARERLVANVKGGQLNLARERIFFDLHNPPPSLSRDAPSVGKLGHLGHQWPAKLFGSFFWPAVKSI